MGVEGVEGETGLEPLLAAVAYPGRRGRRRRRTARVRSVATKERLGRGTAMAKCTGVMGIWRGDWGGAVRSRRRRRW